MAALDRPLGYEVINLGVGAPISLREFIEVIEELAGRKLNTRDVPTPPSDPPITFCDNSESARSAGLRAANHSARRAGENVGMVPRLARQTRVNYSAPGALAHSMGGHMH